MFPSLPPTRRTGGEHRWVATTPELLKPFCHFPFHCHGKLEGKLFKPKRVEHARAVVFFVPPMEFVHVTRMISNVQESSLYVWAQIAMLNHANVLWTATAPAPPKPGQESSRAYTENYTEEAKVTIKARGVALLQEFLSAPAGKRIPLSAGLLRVANGTSGEADDASEAASESEAAQLEPMPLPGAAVDTFDHSDGEFE